MILTEAPYQFYTDTDGDPLDSGYIYFGLPNQNPETAPVAIYWDQAGTIPAAQPVRTLNGYIVRPGASGTPANVYTLSNYSITVRNKKRQVVYYAADSLSFSDAAFTQNGAGAYPVSVPDKLRERVSVLDFVPPSQRAGIIAGTSTFDCTDAFNAALASFSRTSPPGYTNYGLGRIYVPKGEYVVNGTVSVNLPIGVVFEGDGEFTTTIVRTNDAGALFQLTAYIDVMFEKMAILHNPTGARASWTNTVFSLNGSGGGRQLEIRNVTTQNFNTVILHGNTVNEDKNVVDHSTFYDCTTFLNSENTQAVVNTYSNCSWAGAISQVFWIAGNPNTVLSSCSVICDGTLLKYKNVSGKFNDSGFVLINVRMEWVTANTVAGSAPKFIDAVGQFIRVRLNMIDCALTGGATPAADALWARIGCNVTMDVSGSRLDGKVELIDTVGPVPENAYSLKIVNTRLSDPATWVYTLSGTPGARFLPVSLTDCKLPSLNPGNITYGSHLGVPYVNPRRTVVLGRLGNASPTYTTEVVNIDMPSYNGQLLYANSIKVSVRNANALAGRKVEIYSDAARAVLIGTVNIPNAIINDTVYDAVLSSPTSTAGFFFTVTSTGSSINLVIVVDFTSV